MVANFWISRKLRLASQEVALVLGHHQDRTPTHGYEPTRKGRVRALGRPRRRPLAKLATAGVPYHKRGELPMNGRSILASAPYERGDEQEGGWPREQLERMDQRFVERMQLAIERGLERKPNGEGPARAA